MIKYLHPKYGQPIGFVLACIVITCILLHHAYLAIITFAILMVVEHLTLHGAAHMTSTHQSTDLIAIAVMPRTRLCLFHIGACSIVASTLIIGARFVLVMLGVIAPNLTLGIVLGVWLVVSQILFCVLAMHARTALQRETEYATIQKIKALGRAYSRQGDTAAEPQLHE